MHARTIEPHHTMPGGLCLTAVHHGPLACRGNIDAGVLPSYKLASTCITYRSTSAPAIARRAAPLLCTRMHTYQACMGMSAALVRMSPGRLESPGRLRRGAQHHAPRTCLPCAAMAVMQAGSVATCCAQVMPCTLSPHLLAHPQQTRRKLQAARCLVSCAAAAPCAATSQHVVNGIVWTQHHLHEAAALAAVQHALHWLGQQQATKLPGCHQAV